ncbi:MAG: hypothetical protein HYX53_15360 [Chloroflexi bacterium]|nr:hypothetical protein [Chloroflexota bacterium]
MASLTLKNIPEDLLARLRQRAACERRSLSAEALTLLERALATDYRTPAERARLEQVLDDVAARNRGLFDWDVDAIYAARTFGRDVEL